MIEYADVDSLVTDQIIKVTNKALNKLARLRKEFRGWDAFWLINNDGSGTVYYFRDGEEEARTSNFRTLDDLLIAIDEVRKLILDEDRPRDR